MHATRRQLLAAATVAALPQPPPAAAPGWLPSIAARVDALRGPGLLRSYDVQGDGDFDRTNANCAYVYDNAAAGLALLAGGRIAQARLLGDALMAAQGRDRFWHDGRLRNAYAAGPAPATGSYPLPGWWNQQQNRWVEDAYQAGTATGVLAWAMLLWLALQRATGEVSYGVAAARAANWITTTLRAPRGYSGGFTGFEPAPQRIAWVSTEHNLDLAVALAALGRPAEAAHAQDFVAAMWLDQPGRFAIGLHPDGRLNDGTAADANLWPLLVPWSHPAWQRALPWVLAHQGVPQPTPQGIDFNDDRDGIWLEGTAYAALAAHRLGHPAIAATLLATLRAQTSPAGLVWATSVPRLTTGLSTGLTQTPDFVYYRRPHLGATAWAALASMGSSPFAG